MEEDKKKVSFWLERSQYDAMERLARGRGDDAVAGVMREAVREYIEKRENPGKQVDMVYAVLCEHPELLDEPLRRYSAMKLRGDTSSRQD